MQTSKVSWVFVVCLLGSCVVACSGGTAGGGAIGTANDPELDATVPVVGADAGGDGGGSEARAKLGQPVSFGAGMPFVCRKNAFCDDFEEAAPLARWTNSVVTLGAVDFVGPSASHGVKALRASTTGSGGAAFLVLAGPALGQTWAGSLGFALRVDALPAKVLGGPEIAVTDTSGAITRIGFSVRPEGIALHQYFESCAGHACEARSDLVSDVRPGVWRTLTVGIETSGSSAPPYGRIEVTVDGGDLIVLPLSVTHFDGRAEVHAGITVADSVPATARIDDVVFFTH